MSDKDAEIKALQDMIESLRYVESEEHQGLLAENARLRDENFSLAAWQCEFTDGKRGLVASEGGSTYCAMAREVERLRAALEEAANDLEDWGGYAKASKARAALEGK